MTTRVMITNHGPDKVLVDVRDNTGEKVSYVEGKTLDVSENLEMYVYENHRVCITEVK